MSSIALFMATGIVVRKNGENRSKEAYSLMPVTGNDFVTTDDGKVVEFNASFKGTTKKYIYVGYEHLLEADKKRKILNLLEASVLKKSLSLTKTIR